MIEELLRRIEMLEARVYELSEAAHFHDSDYNSEGELREYRDSQHFSSPTPGPEGPWHIAIDGVPACKSGVRIKGMYGDRDPKCHSKNYHDLTEERWTLDHQNVARTVEIVKGECE